MNKVARLIKRYRKLKRTMEMHTEWCTKENIEKLDYFYTQIASLTPKWK